MVDEILTQLIAGLRRGGIDVSKPPVEVRTKFDAMLSTLPVANDVIFAHDRLGGVPGLRATTSGVVSDTALSGSRV